MTVQERVTARIDSLERQARRALGWTGRIRGCRGRNVESDAQWTVDVWAPSLRRRAERHRPFMGGEAYGECITCGAPDEGDASEDWPCPDFRDLCAELGINPEETT
jgi:hypothetical protein